MAFEAVEIRARLLLPYYKKTMQLTRRHVLRTTVTETSLGRRGSNLYHISATFRMCTNDGNTPARTQPRT